MNHADGVIPATIAEILDNDESMSSCAGLSSLLEFQKICESVEYAMITLNIKDAFQLDVRCRVLLTLMRLKLNVSFRCLACFFRISHTAASDYFIHTIDVMYILFKQFIVWLPPTAIRENLPIYFHIFSDTRVILDCAELPVQKNKCLNCCVRTYSSYKGTHTIKFLLGISPDGVITFRSPIWWKG